MEKCHFRETLPHSGSLLSGTKSIKKSLKSDKITSLAPKMDQDGTKSIKNGIKSVQNWTKRDPKLENVSKKDAKSLQNNAQTHQMFVFQEQMPSTIFQNKSAPKEAK